VKTPACRVNAAELDPWATVTEEGAVSKLLTTDTRTLAPPASAFCVSVTVQALEVDGPSVAGLQTSEETSTDVTRLTLVLTELPLYAAVIVALRLALTEPVVTLKVADAAPAATVTDPGTLRVALVSVRVTAAPPVGAAWVRVTVQVLEVLGPRLVGVQASEETSTDAARLMVALAELLL